MGVGSPYHLLLSLFLLPVPTPENICICDLSFNLSPNQENLGHLQIFNNKHCFNESLYMMCMSLELIPANRMRGSNCL